jgi:hypothetical protein
MGAHPVVLATARVKAFTGHQDDLNNGLRPAEKAFVAAMRSLLDNGLTDAADAGAKRFLETAPSPQAARRRAYALLRLAGERINDSASLGKENGIEGLIKKPFKH